MKKHLLRLLLIPLLSMALLTAVSFTGAPKAHAAYVECSQTTWGGIGHSQPKTSGSVTIQAFVQEEFDNHDDAPCGGLRGYATISKGAETVGGTLKVTLSTGGHNFSASKSSIPTGSYSGSVATGNEGQYGGCGTAQASFNDLVTAWIGSQVCDQ